MKLQGRNVTLPKPQRNSGCQRNGKHYRTTHSILEQKSRQTPGMVYWKAVIQSR